MYYNYSKSRQDMKTCSLFDRGLLFEVSVKRDFTVLSVQCLEVDNVIPILLPS